MQTHKKCYVCNPNDSGNALRKVFYALGKIINGYKYAFLIKICLLKYLSLPTENIQLITFYGKHSIRRKSG